MNFSFNYSIRSDFVKVGYFKLAKHNKFSLIQPGILVLKDGIIKLTIFGIINNASKYNRCQKSSNNFKLTGILNDDKKIICNKFNLLKDTFNRRHNNKRFFIDKFLIYDLSIKDPINSLMNYNVYTFGINIDHFFQWSYFPGVLPKNKSFDKYDMNKINFKGQIYYPYISYYKISNTKPYSSSTTKHSILNLTTKNRPIKKNLLDLCQEIYKLMRLLTNLNLTPLNISCKHGNITSNNLHSHSLKLPKITYQWFNSPLSFKYISDSLGHDGFSYIFKNFIQKSNKLSQMVNSLLNESNTSNSELPNLVNNANSIGSYFNNATFPSNGKTIKNLSDKLRIPFINQIPNNIKLLILHTSCDKRIKDFTIQVANTRNNYVHNSKRFNNKTLKGLNLITATSKLHWLTYYFVLNKIGLPNNLIYIFIKVNANGTKKSDYL